MIVSNDGSSVRIHPRTELRVNRPFPVFVPQRLASDARAGPGVVVAQGEALAADDDVGETLIRGAAFVRSPGGGADPAMRALRFVEVVDRSTVVRGMLMSFRWGGKYARVGMFYRGGFRFLRSRWQKRSWGRKERGGSSGWQNKAPVDGDGGFQS